MKTWVKVVIGVVIVAILAVTAGPFIYINFIKDDPEPEFSIDQVPADSSVDDTTLTTDAAATTSTEASSTPVDTGSGDTDSGETTTSAAASTSGADGTYAIAADSQVGYRVVEVLFGQDTEGVGRTNSVTGSLTIEGTQVTTAEFTVDMATVESDESRRDNQFRGRIMETDQFPTATFVLTEPIELGSIPADDTEITATATGDLTLHGVTNSVTFEVTAKKTGDSIAVVGSTDITFADYDIDDPSTSGISTQDHGLLEFLLVFAKA